MRSVCKRSLLRSTLARKASRLKSRARTGSPPSATGLTCSPPLVSTKTSMCFRCWGRRRNASAM